RPHIVHPEVQPRMRPEGAQSHPDLEAVRHIHKSDDSARGQHPGLRHADQYLAPVQRKLDPVLAMGVIADAERGAVPRAVARGIIHEPVGIEAAHAASRAALSRISAIMFGMPWVRLELSWRVRSKRASSAVMSRPSISAGARSCTATRVREAM